MIDLNRDRKNYYTQMNNEDMPKDSCQSTAMVQCIDTFDQDVIKKLISMGPYKQPEDNLHNHCGSEAGVKLCVASHGVNWMKQVGHPAEWADVLQWATNDIAGYKITMFNPNVNYALIVRELNKGMPVLCSMRYATIPGHYVSVVGLNDNGSLIIDDPYKNDLTGDKDGYHNEYSIKDFNEHCKGYGFTFNRRAA